MLKDALSDTWKLFRLHYAAFVAIILPIVIPVTTMIVVYQPLLQNKEFGFAHLLPVMLNVAAEPLYAVGVIFYISSFIYKGEIIDAKRAWMLGVKYWSPYLILNILMGFIIGAGAVFLIIPGVIFMVRFSFAKFELLLKGCDPAEAMKNSWMLTRDYMIELIGGFALLFVVLVVPYFILQSTFTGSGLLYQLSDIILTLVYSVLQVLFTIFAFRIYDHANEKRIR